MKELKYKSVWSLQMKFNSEFFTDEFIQIDTFKYKRDAVACLLSQRACIDFQIIRVKCITDKY